MRRPKIINTVMLQVRKAWTTRVFKFEARTACCRDLYFVLNPITWICRVFGIFPLKLEGPIGKRKYSSSYGWMIYSLIVLVLTSTGLYAWTGRTNERHTKLSEYAIVRISINFEITLELSSMLLLIGTAILNKDRFAIAIDILNSQNESLRKLGTELDYTADLKQHYIQLGITLLGVVILCIYDFAYQFQFNWNHPLNWIAWLCPNVIRIASACLFMNVVIILKQRFAALNDHLRRMIEETKVSQPETLSTSDEICKRIHSIAMIHGNLCEAAANVNQCFGWNIIAGLVYSIIILTTSIYYIFHELKDPDCSYVQVLGYVDWAILSSSHIITTVTACHFAQEQASLSGKLIHRFQNSGADSSLNNVIQSFSLQLHHEKIEFSGAGLFPLDATLIQSVNTNDSYQDSSIVVGAVTTYLIILLQFDA